MRKKHQRIQAVIRITVAIIAMAFISVFAGCSEGTPGRQSRTITAIVASDTILSGMIASLLPGTSYSVEAIMPPGQCPGHYDVKLSDIERMKRAALIVSFKGMSFMYDPASGEGSRIAVDAKGRNWMAPHSYIDGLDLLAEELSRRFPQVRTVIMARKRQAIEEVKTEALTLADRLRQAGIVGTSAIASSMQKEPLEWMGFRVVAEYGRPEAISAREIVRLVKTGRSQKAVLVVDNMQSGPDTGRGIAESLKIPHVVLTNFPSEKGYLATLRENVDSVIRALTEKKTPVSGALMGVSTHD